MGTFQTNHMGNIIFQNAPPHAMLMNAQMAGPARHMAQQAQAPLPFIAPRPPMMPDMSPTGMPHHFQHHMHQQPMPMPMQGLPLHHQQTPQVYHQNQQMPLHPHQMAYMPPQVPPQPDPHMDPTAFPQQWQQPLPDNVAINTFNPPNIPPSLVSPVSYESVPTPVDTSATQIPVNAGPWAGSSEPLSDVTATPASQDQVQNFVNEAGESTSYVFDGQNVYWFPDDDASMIASDDEEEESDDEAQHLESNDLGAIVAKRLQNRPIDAFGTQMRTFSNFADANVLATYVPSSINSPLNDAQTASVFWYFVNVTGPSMSLFERRPFDPSPIFQGQPVPRSRQHIWTCKWTIISWVRASFLEDFFTDYKRYLPNHCSQPPCSASSNARSRLPPNGETSRSTSHSVDEALPSKPAAYCAQLRKSFSAGAAGNSGRDHAARLLRSLELGPRQVVQTSMGC